MEIKTITLDDYQRLIPFWKQNYFVNEMDSFDRFKLFLEKNPELSIYMEDNGEIVGTALGSFDGRRGYLQKVVVSKTARKKGVGRELVLEVIKRLKMLSALYIPISCEKENVGFYEKCGFRKTKQVAMNINL